MIVADIHRPLDLSRPSLGLASRYEPLDLLTSSEFPRGSRALATCRSIVESMPLRLSLGRALDKNEFCEAFALQGLWRQEAAGKHVRRVGQKIHSEITHPLPRHKHPTLTPPLLHQPHAPQHHSPVHRLAHVVDGEQRHRHR
jgi:hypothetical protein